MDGAVGVEVRAVILVEGVSDRVALETLARRRGRELGAEGVRVVPMGGATNVARYLQRFGPPGEGLRLAGLCDAGEAGWFARGLVRAGVVADPPSEPAMRELGFHVAHADLEDELIRALGPPAARRVVEAEPGLGSFRTFQNQPAQRGRPLAAQLHRFIGARSGGKERYAQRLVEALADDAVPAPLAGVLAAVLS